MPEALEGYLCSCGFTTDDLSTFRGHIAAGSKEKDAHRSKGRVNLLSGEITMPPFAERTKEQKKETSIGKRKKESTSGDGGGIKVTEILSQASTIKFVPRQMTCTYTPIMASGLEAVTRIFHWREDMPFENFLDTIIYNYLLEHGIQLAGFIVDDSIREAEEKGESGDGDESETEPEPSNGNGQVNYPFLRTLEEV